MEVSPEQLAALVHEAERAREKAYAPCSKFKVGAAVLARSGRIYSGCNVENASYRLTTCAEQTAISHGVAEEGGGNFAIEAVAVTAGTNVVCSPCGACRQTIFEFGPQAVVSYQTAAGRVVKSITELLPDGFRLEQ